MGTSSIRPAAVLSCIAVACVLAVALAGCGGGGDTPSAAAESFLNAMIAHDNPSSYGLFSVKSQGEMGVTAMTWPGVMMANPIPQSASFTITGESIEGDTATVTITTGGGAGGTVGLSKEDGRWLVDYQLGEWYGLAPGF